jgi:protein arginine kinase activator
MFCQDCKKRPATLHFTKILNGEKTEFHLCDVCAGEKGDMFPGSPSNFSIHHLLSGLLNFEGGPSLGEVKQEKALRCESCGLTYTQFSKSGRFGCIECYTQFAERLDPIFRRIHGSMQHSGKVPERSGEKIKLKKQLEDLKQTLRQRISDEEFEEAAVLRDQIKKLEQQVQSHE